MNAKFWISVVVMFVLSMMLGFAVHGALLAPDYARLPNLMRNMEDSQKFFGYMILGHVFLAFGFTWIYLKGREATPWLAQGIRYGIAVAVLTTVPTYLIYHAVMPFPMDLVVKQICYDTVSVVLMGVVLAFINKTA
jgi:cytochrome bd-type quinol oxidase subunit 2